VLVAGFLAVGLLGVLSVSAGAQTGDLAAFCAARMEANAAQTKSENQAVLDKLNAAAPAAVSGPMSDLLSLFKKKGMKAFESEQGLALIAQIDAFVYDNCPGKQVGVTASDYQFTGMPTTLPAGPTKFKLTNSAPKENHEMAILRLTSAGQSLDLMKLLGTPENKSGKYIDNSKSAFMYAPAGQVGYTPLALEPPMR
jgi:hypothetical protein